MKNVLYHLLHNPLLTKINSFLIALFLWSLLSNWRIIEISKVLPLCLNSLQYCIKAAPATIHIILKGPRASFKNIDWNTIAVRVNVDTLERPADPLVITHKHLFLPNTIKLISSNPSPIIIDLEKK